MHMRMEFDSGVGPTCLFSFETSPCTLMSPNDHQQGLNTAMVGPYYHTFEFLSVWKCSRPLMSAYEFSLELISAQVHDSKMEKNHKFSNDLSLLFCQYLSQYFKNVQDKMSSPLTLLGLGGAQCAHRVKISAKSPKWKFRWTQHRSVNSYLSLAVIFQKKSGQTDVSSKNGARVKVDSWLFFIR